MNRRGAACVLFVLVVLTAAASGVGLLFQRDEATRLKLQRELREAELQEWSRLKAENTRLRASQVSAAELEALRADHAALPRLRAELEALSRATDVR